MNLHFYPEKEDYLIKDSINNYQDIFIEYTKKTPTLKEALNQLFICSGISEEKEKKYTNNILIKSENIVNI